MVQKITLGDIQKIVSNSIKTKDSVLIKQMDDGNIHITMGLYDSFEQEFINFKITDEFEIVDEVE